VTLERREIRRQLEQRGGDVAILQQCPEGRALAEQLAGTVRSITFRAVKP